MAERNGEDRENTEVDVASSVSNPVRSKAKRSGASTMRGLPRPEQHYDPQPIPAPAHAGAPRLSPGGTVVHQDGS